MSQQSYRDPTFDEVAAREAAAQRKAERERQEAARLAARRESPAYQAQRRRKIARLAKLAMAGKLK